MGPETRAPLSGGQTMTTTYLDDARRDAAETVRNFLDEVVEQLIDRARGASDDLYNDYHDGDSYHHETHVDKAYNLQEAAELLDQLSEYEETDSGLWEGLAPREAIGAQAAYTYGQAVSCLWAELIKEINEDDTIEELATEAGQLLGTQALEPLTGDDTEEGLVAGINDDPDDLARWGVYADWLDENDCPERAAAIRLGKGTRAALEQKIRARVEELCAKFEE